MTHLKLEWDSKWSIQEWWCLRASPETDGAEEELYIKGRTVIWSQGSHGRWITLRSFTSEFPVQLTCWARFQDEPTLHQLPIGNDKRNIIFSKIIYCLLIIFPSCQIPHSKLSASWTHTTLISSRTMARTTSQAHRSLCQKFGPSNREFCSRWRLMCQPIRRSRPSNIHSYSACATPTTTSNRSWRNKVIASVLWPTLGSGLSSLVRIHLFACCIVPLLELTVSGLFEKQPFRWFGGINLTIVYHPEILGEFYSQRQWRDVLHRRKYFQRVHDW